MPNSASRKAIREGEREAYSQLLPINRHACASMSIHEQGLGVRCLVSIIRRQGLGVKCSRPNPLRRPFHPPTSPPPGGRRGGRGPESAGRGRRGGKEMTWFVCIFVFSMTFLISLHLHDNRFCISFNIPKYIDSVFSCQAGENQGRGGGSRTLSGHQDRHPPQRHEQAILLFFGS